MLYPIGIQDFSSIREGGYAYVDKTEQIYKLSHGSGKYFFLSRPRRFGKSLLVSTMDAYFCGRRELFEGLAIAQLEKDWKQYPVLRMDFSGKAYDKADVLEKVLDDSLSRWEKKYDCVNKSDVAGLRFANVIEAAHAKTGLPVVILIDEYDKPIVDNLGNEHLMEVFRTQLQGFYSVMKSMDGHIRLGFLTGVSKLGKLSVFSGLNNLMDISMDARYADICGISEAELRSYFPEGVKELAAANGMSEDECYAELARMYDGYHFHHAAVGMYNPFSLLNTLSAGEFRQYWFATGTPSFLVEIMKRTEYDVTSLSAEEADSTLLTNIDTVFYNPIPLLYQAGYLTIKAYDRASDIYTLGFPNHEVKQGFLSFLLDYYTTARGSGNLLVRQMGNDLAAGRPHDFMKRLEAFFARQNYQIQGNAERDFQYAMSIILQLLGEYISVHTEDATSQGRIDILAQTPKFVYIIELKINGSAEEALRQIEERGYARKFADEGRKLFKLGVSFSTESRCIDSWELA